MKDWDGVDDDPNPKKDLTTLGKMIVVVCFIGFLYLFI